MITFTMGELRELVRLHENVAGDETVHVVVYRGIAGLAPAQLEALLGDRIRSDSGVVHVPDEGGSAGKLGLWWTSASRAIGDAVADPVDRMAPLLPRGGTYDVVLRGEVDVPSDTVDVARAVRDLLLDVLVTDVVFAKNTGTLHRRQRLAQLVPQEWKKKK